MLKTQLSLSLLIASLSLTALAGPKYAETTKPLSQDHAYLKETSQTDYWKLAPHYLPQHNPKACSVASTAMVMSALQATGEVTSSTENFTSERVVKMNKAFDRAVGKVGKGMDLDTYGKNLQAILDQAFKGKYTAQVHRFDGKDPASEKKKLVELLTQNEKSHENFIVGNFLQGVLTGDPEGMVGHISPVGAFDAKRDRVLILDSDRQYYEPYWVSVEKFMEAMNTKDEGVKKSRGLVFVTPKS